MPRLKPKPSSAACASTFFKRDARVERIGLAAEGVVGRHPGELRLPRQLDDVIEIGHRGDLVVVRRLAEAVERVAGIELGAVRHVLEMVERHHLALGHAVNVDIGADAIFDALWRAVRACVCLIFSAAYIGCLSFVALPALADGFEIRLVERRRLAQPARDQRAQILDHPFEPQPSLGGIGPARCAGDAVAAGAVDRMGEDQACVYGRGRRPQLTDSGRTISGASASISEVSASLACQSSASAK